MSISVLLVDDHPIFRKGIHSLIEVEPDIRVIGEAGDGQDAIEQTRELSPDVVVMDISLPELNGIEATRQIISSSPNTKVVALSIHAEKQFVKDILHAGASALILKDSDPGEMLIGIRKVMHNEVYLSKAISGVVLKGFLENGSDKIPFNEPHQGATDKSAGILQTKLNPPAMTGDRWVARPRLISRMAEDSSKRVTLISAPPGYGKSTLAAQLLEKKGRRLSAWLSLDRHDSDPVRFLHYVLAAVRMAEPEFGSEIEPLLSAPQPPPPNYLADAVITDLEVLQNPLRLVLDDFHTMVSEPVQAIVVRVIKHLPRGVHLVVATRIDPAWPMALWRLRNWLNEVRASDLLFSKKETRMLFSQSLEGPLAAETVDMLHRQTEGWIAGLQLARLSFANMRAADRLARKFSHSDRLVVDFLMEEVVAQQPLEILEFLEATALTKRFCAPLCEFMLVDESEMIDCRRLIMQLERQNLFIISLDGEKYWYRYHHLFQNLLKHHLTARLTPQRKTHLQQRAAQWFAGEGLIEEAIELYIEAGNVNAAAGLVEENLYAAIDEDLSRQKLGRWLNMFPDIAISRQPALKVALSYLNLFRWDFKTMTTLLDQTEALLHDPAIAIGKSRRLMLQGDIDVQRANLYYWKGDVEGALKHALQALRVIPQSHRFAYNMAITYAALSRALLGRRYEALIMLDEALTDDLSAGSRNAAQLLVAKTAIHYYQGEFNAVEEAAKQILKIHEIVSLPEYWYGYAHYFLGCVAYERNYLDTAANHFRRVMQMRYRVTTRVYQEVTIGLALVACARGELDKAREYAVSARSFAMEMGDPYSNEISDSLQVRMAIFFGKRRNLPAKASSISVDSTKLWLETPSLTRAEHLVRKNTTADCRTAYRFIQDFLKGTQKYHNTRQRIQFKALKVVALHCSGRRDEALKVLEEVLCLAKPSGFVRIIADRGPRMAEMLELLSKRRPHDTYLHRLLDAFHCEKVPEKVSNPDRCDAPEMSGTNARESKILSNREIDVLMLLEKRLSNKEIADQLFVSPETIKKHTINIYRKLKVNNRRQATAAARQRGLLPVR